MSYGLAEMGAPINGVFMTTQIALQRHTMSSREIAELVEARHDSVKRTIERLIEKKVITSPPLVDVQESGGNSRTYTTQQYLFSGEKGKRDSIVVVAQLCPEFTARLVDRWQELEHLANVPLLPSVDMRAIGGMMKGIVQKQLSELLPALVNEQLLTGDRRVIQGMSALEVAEQAGYTKGRRPKGLTQFITGKLLNYHIQRKFFPERSPHGSSNVWVYNPAVVRAWLKDGGQVEIDNYAAKKKGQGTLRLLK